MGKLEDAIAEAKRLGPAPSHVFGMVREAMDDFTKREEAGAAPWLNVGATVKFRAHLEGFFAYTVTNRIGDEFELRDPRGRTLANVPVELLERVGDEPQRIEA